MGSWSKWLTVISALCTIAKRTSYNTNSVPCLYKDQFKIEVSHPGFPNKTGHY